MRRYGVAVFAAAAVTIVVASGAWACTNQPQVFSVTPLAAVAGAEVTMRGEAVPANSAVELRWNGVAGPKVAEVTADQVGNFAMAFTVPDVAPGVYSLTVVPNGATAGLGRAPFEVRGAAGAPGTSLQTVGGFASDPQPASLHEPAGANPVSGLAAGMAIFGFGAVALSAGFTVATVRRRSVVRSR